MALARRCTSVGWFSARLRHKVLCCLLLVLAQVAAVFTVPLRRFLDAGPGYSSRDVEWQPGLPYRWATGRVACRQVES